MTDQQKDDGKDKDNDNYNNNDKERLVTFETLIRIDN